MRGENDARKRSHNPIRKGPGGPAPTELMCWFLCGLGW